MLHAVAFASGPPLRAVIAGDPAQPETQALLRAAHRVYQPHRVVLGTTGPVEPFAKTLLPREGKPTAYICTGTSCRPPTADPAEVRKNLRPPGKIIPEEQPCSSRKNLGAPSCTSTTVRPLACPGWMLRTGEPFKGSFHKEETVVRGESSANLKAL
jgi:hypothetical protein